MENKKYWQSFGERNESEAYKQSVKDEFPKAQEPQIPFDESKGVLDAVTPRRDFLKYLGFSTAAAAIAAGCETPVHKSIPFANKPEDLVPGQADYYATTYVQDGDVLSILARVRDGRPIKITGNNQSPIYKGCTSARAEASVLDLYNTARLRFPYIKDKEATFAQIDKALASDIAGNVVVLTSTIVSPSTKEIIASFLAKYPGGKHVTYDAVSYAGILAANESTFGKRAIPSYKFENAQTIVSIGADFLGTWLSPTEFTKQYAVNRRIDEKKPAMSRHYQFESVLSPTGASADYKFLCKPSEWGKVAVALLNAVNGQAVSGISDAKLVEGIKKVAKDLAETKGKALVVSGSNDPNVQIAVNALNQAIGAYGTTIDWAITLNNRAGYDADFAQLVADMNAGTVNTLLVYGANPAYNYFDADKFKKGLEKVRTTVSFSSFDDETTQLCKYKIPDHHYLESWGDAEPKSGYFSFIQPTINPLFKTRQWQDSLLKWAGAGLEYAAYLKQYWSAKLGGEGGWFNAIQTGVLNPAETAASAGAFNSAAVANAISAIGATKTGSDIEVLLYQKVSIGEGQGANNPFLQEMPDPITCSTWDNYFVISPKIAKSLLNIDITNEGQSDDYEVHPEKEVLKLTINGKELTLPFLIVPGTQADTIGVAVGYGRSEKIGKAAKGSGKNVYPFSYVKDGFVNYNLSGGKLERTGEKYTIAQTQTHGRYDSKIGGKRVEVMKELTLAQFVHDPKEIFKEREHEFEEFGGLENFEKQGTIYPYHEKPGIHWAMSVDLNACTGCGACVVACSIENNVPIVGKGEVARFHDMHWLRIDRYYSGDVENPDVVFQPMMCQHCDNAPCENVCPVSATNHSTEGLNQMAYNRCIGTRYCANNCPYKVRRFNWADYTGADSFKNNQDQKLVGDLGEVVLDMNDDLTRMVLNPDVTVRSRGVIEKCSFCVQRLQDAKLKAKRESRPMVDSDIETACQSSCPSDCFVFGNVNDKNSAISKTRKDNPYRLFYSLEQLHVMPNVNYLTKVRNKTEMEEAAEA